MQCSKSLLRFSTCSTHTHFTYEDYVKYPKKSNDVIKLPVYDCNFTVVKFFH